MQHALLVHTWYSCCVFFARKEIMVVASTPPRCCEADGMLAGVVDEGTRAVVLPEDVLVVGSIPPRHSAVDCFLAAVTDEGKVAFFFVVALEEFWVSFGPSLVAILCASVAAWVMVGLLSTGAGT